MNTRKSHSKPSGKREKNGVNAIKPLLTKTEAVTIQKRHEGVQKKNRGSRGRLP